jgi:hypothetical protein
MQHIAFWPHVGVAVIAVALLIVGFALRRHPGGVLMIWIGLLSMLALIVHTVMAAVNA